MNDENIASKVADFKDLIGREIGNCEPENWDEAIQLRTVLALESIADSLTEIARSGIGVKK